MKSMTKANNKKEMFSHTKLTQMYTITRQSDHCSMFLSVSDAKSISIFGRAHNSDNHKNKKKKSFRLRWFGSGAKHRD